MLPADPTYRIPPQARRRIIFGDYCWLWTGSLLAGYGQVWVGPQRWLLHRLVYTLLVGPIPDGLTLDHTCRIRKCCNPQHLEPVTRGENTARAHRRPVACTANHPRTPENTYVFRGTNYCRPCRRQHAAAHRARRKEQTNG